MAHHQLQLSEWPLGLTEEVAVLKQEPEDFESIGALLFEETHDDLDYFKAVLVAPENSVLFALKRYRNCPAPGVGLIVSKGTPEEMKVFLVQSLNVLNLDAGSVTWLRDDIRPHWS
jgi:hypothetical protein